LVPVHLATLPHHGGILPAASQAGTAPVKLVLEADCFSGIAARHARTDQASIQAFVVLVD